MYTLLRSALFSCLCIRTGSGKYRLKHKKAARPKRVVQPCCVGSLYSGGLLPKGVPLGLTELPLRKRYRFSYSRRPSPYSSLLRRRLTS